MRFKEIWGGPLLGGPKPGGGPKPPWFNTFPPPGRVAKVKTQACFGRAGWPAGFHPPQSPLIKIISAPPSWGALGGKAIRTFLFPPGRLCVARDVPGWRAPPPFALIVSTAGLCGARAAARRAARAIVAQSLRSPAARCQLPVGEPAGRKPGGRKQAWFYTFLSSGNVENV